MYVRDAPPDWERVDTIRRYRAARCCVVVRTDVNQEG